MKNLERNFYIIMGKIHSWLEENIPSYASWHRVPEHRAVHFTALIVAGVVLSGILVGSISVAYAQSTAAIASPRHTSLNELNTELLRLSKKYNA